MNQQHKHAEVIKAWADGAIIQYRENQNNDWYPLVSQPKWHFEFEYRVKPEVRKYRVALFKAGVLAYDGDEQTIANESVTHIDFIRWLTDWVEYEV